MFKLTYKPVFIIVILAFLSQPLWAEPAPRLVTVAGEAEIMAAPDEVWVNLQVEIFDADLSKAKEANDIAIKQVLDIVNKYKVDENDFRTDYFMVRNDERYFMDPQTNQQRSKKGFFVTKNVSIILRDISKFEALYSEALQVGVNNIYGVEFKTSKLKEYKDQARVLAVRDAKEKASKLAGELGQEINRPYSIEENVRSDWSPPRMAMARAMTGGAEAGGNETIALGQIKITASVTVSFELK